MSDNFPTTGRKVKKKPKPDRPLLQGILYLCIKLLIIVAFLLITFGLIFGIERITGVSMSPALSDGDLVVYSHFDKSYIPSDVIVLRHDDQTQVRRVIATEGDTVDIKDGYLLVNGAVIQEKNIYTDTNSFIEGISFPITVGEEEVFVLGDNRPDTEDSRIYGCVPFSDIRGTVFMVLRQRGI